MDQWEREEEAIERDYEKGFMKNKQRNEALRDLRRDYAAAARESALEAYETEMERW